MNYRIFSLMVSLIILSHLLLQRVDEIQNQNFKLTKGSVSESPKQEKGIKKDIVQYNIENFESDLDIDSELDYDLDIQYKYRDDSLQIDLPDVSKLAAQNNKNLDSETIANPTLYKWDEQSKTNIHYSDPSASQGIRTIKPYMYTPLKNEKIINGGYVDEKRGLRPFDNADCGFAAI